MHLAAVLRCQRHLSAELRRTRQLQPRGRNRATVNRPTVLLLRSFSAIYHAITS